jgi:predicted phosphodiesterase
MRIIVFSDVHGNFESLRRVAAEIGRMEPELVVSLGDVVGYGARPGECVDLVMEIADINISGNHDLAVAGLTPFDRFNASARCAIDWTASRLTEGQIEYLKSSQPLFHHGKSLFAHASPLSPLDWPYITTLAQSREIMQYFEEKFIFIGHTHIPAVISYDQRGRARYLLDSPVEIREDCRYLINAGSVGQPRDGINAACLTLLDTGSGVIEQRRIKYDYRTSQEKIINAGLPEKLATRLETGE